jgi:hypothetical protein
MKESGQLSADSERAESLLSPFGQKLSASDNKYIYYRIKCEKYLIISGFLRQVQAPA